MPEPIPVAASGGSRTQAETGANEAGLRAEIAFWKEMLEICGDDTPPESLERMGFALALAEKRLKTLFDEYSTPGKVGDSPPNVFHLDRVRRQA